MTHMRYDFKSKENNRYETKITELILTDINETEEMKIHTIVLKLIDRETLYDNQTVMIGLRGNTKIYYRAYEPSIDSHDGKIVIESSDEIIAYLIERLVFEFEALPVFEE